MGVLIAKSIKALRIACLKKHSKTLIRLVETSETITFLIMMGSTNSTASSSNKEASRTGSNTQTRLTRIRGPSRESNTVSQMVTSDISPEENEITSLLTDEDDDITIIEESNEPQLPHARKDCRRHRFCSSVNATANSNVPHCDTCFCYACDIPAKDCKTWQEHCNVIDDVSGKHLRLCNKNKFYSTLVGLILKSPPSTILPVREEEKELYNMRSKVVSKVERGFRLYEAGQPMENAAASSVQGGWQHKFSFASTYFQREFFKTRASSVHDKDLCKKLILLDALTETVVKRTYRKPEHSSGAVWDSAAGRIYDRMCLSVGSRWITFAFMATFAQPEIVDQFHERFEAFAAMAKERYNFDRGFKVVRDMFKDDGNNFMQPSSILLKSVQRRWVHHASALEDTHQNRLKLEEVMLKDNILLKGCLAMLEKKKFPSEETVTFQKQLKWLKVVQNMSLHTLREYVMSLGLADDVVIEFFEQILKYSMKRYGYLLKGPSMMKGMMLDRLNLIEYILSSSERVLRLQLSHCRNESKMQKHVALFKMIFKAIRKLLEFIGSGLDTEEKVSAQSVRVTGALQEVFCVAGRFPYPVFAISQMKDLEPAIHFYYETVNQKLQSEEFFRPLQTSLRALYDDPKCLMFRDIFTSFKDHGGDIFRLSQFTRRLRRRLQ